MTALKTLAETLLIKLLSSKKAVMTLIGIVSTYILLPFLNGRLSLGLSADQLNEAIYPFLAYVLGQGLADFGKEGSGKVLTTKTSDAADYDDIG